MNYYDNPLNIFNPNVMNNLNFQLQQCEQQKKHWEQQENIIKMRKAIADYCEARRKLLPEYYQQAQEACLMEIAMQFNLDNNMRNF